MYACSSIVKEKPASPIESVLFIVLRIWFERILRSVRRVNVFSNLVHGVCKFLPGVRKFSKEEFSFFGNLIVLSWWSARRFFPAVGEKLSVFQSCKQWVKGAFHHIQFSFFQFVNQV